MNAETPATTPPRPRVRDVLKQPRMLAILLLGAASGLPNPLSETIMQAWLTDLGLSNTKIGLLMYVALPYLLKPLWAPLLDRYSLPWLGRRRGWILLIQLMLAAAIAWEDEDSEPLLRGDEIMAEAGIEPGPLLGEAIAELEAARFAGEVGDRAAALAHLRAWAEER